MPCAGGQHILQQRAKLQLAPGAAGFHVGENSLQVADLHGHGLHVAHGALQLGELVDDALKAALHLGLDRLVQLLGHAALDGRKAQRRLLAHLTQLRFQQGAGVALVPGHAGGQGAERRLQLEPGLLGADRQRALHLGQLGAGRLRLLALPGRALVGQHQQPL